MATAPTPVDPAPDVPNSSLEEPTFDAQFEAFLTWMADDAQPGFDALAQNAYDNALLAEQAASDSETAQGLAEDARDAAVTAQGLAEDARDAASGHASAAGDAASAAVTAQGLAEDARDASQTAQGLAEDARDASQTAQGLSEDARDAAEAFRDQAEIFATQQLIGSSTTANTPGVGSKSFTIETGRAFVPGMYLVATSTGAPTNKMAGYVSSYNQGTGALVLDVDAYGGASSRSDWAIGVAVAGQVGGITGQRVSTNTSCVANVRYHIAAAGITLTLPASYAANDKQEFVEEIGGGLLWSLNFNGHKLRGQTKGVEDIQANFDAAAFTYFDTTGGLS